MILKSSISLEKSTFIDFKININNFINVAEEERLELSHA